jgi:hypothetical protein
MNPAIVAKPARQNLKIVGGFGLEALALFRTEGIGRVKWVVRLYPFVARAFSYERVGWRKPIAIIRLFRGYMAPLRLRSAEPLLNFIPELHFGLF